MSLMRIDDLFHFEKGSLQSSKCTEGAFDFITASAEWKTHNEYTHDCEALVFAAAASGSLGRTHYVNGKFISSDLCFIITPKNQSKLPIDLKFYHMIFNEFKNDIVNSTKAGTSKEAIGMKAFGNYELPYFEFSKQTEARIQFMNMQHSKVELNSELIHQLDLIKQLRQAFLREAMQGKLITPVTSSGVEKQETGQELLAKIKAEKAQLIADKKLKKEKELPPITKEEIPFEIPKHWAWCRLGAICNYGSSPKAEPKDINEDTWVLDLEDIEKETSLLLNKIRYVERNSLSTKSIFKKGEVLYSKLRPYLDKVIVAEEDGVCTTEILPLKLYGNINPYFVKYALKRSDFLTYVNSVTKGMKMPRLGTNDGQMALFPLPPLHEQEQIVAKLEELMAFCDGLEQSIKESQGYNEKLLQEVLREALQGEEVVNG